MQSIMRCLTWMDRTPKERGCCLWSQEPVKAAAFIHKINGSCEKFVTKGGMSCFPERVVTARDHGPITRPKYLNGSTPLNPIDLIFKLKNKQAWFDRIHLCKSTSAGKASAVHRR